MASRLNHLGSGNDQSNHDYIKFGKSCFKDDLDETMMEIVRRKKEIEDDKYSREFRWKSSKNQSGSDDVGEYENEDEFLKDLDEASQNIKEVCRERCKEYVGRSAQDLNIINEVFQKLKRQIGPEGKNVVEKLEKHKYAGKLNRQMDIPKFDSDDEMLKRSDSILDDMLENYSADEDTDLESKQLSDWSAANRNMYDNLFGDTINKSSKYKNQKDFNEMRHIIDDKLARWAEYEKNLEEKRAEKNKIENISTSKPKGQKSFNTPYKSLARKPPVLKSTNNTKPTSTLKAIEGPEKVNSLPPAAATSLFSQWNLEELNDLAKKLEQDLAREKAKKTPKNTTKAWR